MSSAEGRDAILAAATRQHDLLYGTDHCDRKYLLSCHRMPEIILGLPKPARPASTSKRQISIPRPQIHTGPAHQTVDEATAAYLREAAKRVRENRYWGSGVTRLVADLLDDAARAVEATAELKQGGDG